MVLFILYNSRQLHQADTPGEMVGMSELKWYWDRRPAVPLRQPAELEPLALPGGQTLLAHHVPTSLAGRPVLVLHGIQSHPLWFLASADALAARGHDVYQLQRRGSGQSPAGRGHARSARQLMADLDAAVQYVLARSGADALHLVGISWGGKYAACYALDRARAARLAGLTLVASGIVPRVDLSRRQKALVGLCALAAPRRTFAIPLNDPALFTDNPVWQAYIRDDPYRLHRVTAGFLLASRRMDRRLAAAAPGSLALPVTLILAGRDRIIDNARTRAALERLAGKRLRVCELDGAHTLEFEEDPKPLLEVIIVSVAKT